MSDQLAEIALAFAKECLGWEDARITGNHVECKLGPYEAKWIDYTDLDSVMKAVTEWCDVNPVCPSIEYELGQFDVLMSIYNERGITGKSTAAGPDLSHALLEACVEAQRKLKGAA